MRRFIELEPTVPGVHRVRKVFTGDYPPLSPAIVGAPAGKTDAELLQSVLVQGRWINVSTYLNGDVAERGPVATTKDEILWTGHVYNLGGYAKANREVLFRLRNSIRVKLIRQHDIMDATWHNDEATNKILKDLQRTEISYDAPFVRFFTPSIEMDKRYRICWTMMETQKLHADFTRRLNAYYDEVWTPTEWSKRMFRQSGVRRPIHVIPLGVDPCVYRPMRYCGLPKCKLITTRSAGSEDTPRGFVFIYLFQPTFRKGVDVLASAFESAFSHDPEAALVLATTAYEPLNRGVMDIVRTRAWNSRIYLLHGNFRENDLARFYNASQAFVCTSRGEGWNLPMCEAAACGKPVIVPRHTAHLDLVSDREGFVFDPGPPAPYPNAGQLCGWYDNIPFPTFGQKSHDQLVAILRDVKENYHKALERGERFSEKIRSRYTWDRTAMMVLDRLGSL